ncbi:MAG TPA: type II CAAX endopeptidase family protein [Candidatus Baltobacteraceae bacterium]|nr:type II CAAX endopeptidase family protein [Candidatus Baltobacteraceae bacterium]
MNNSTSTPLPASPTRWPQDSFRPGPTALFILLALGLGAVIFAAGLAWLFVAYGGQIRHGIVPVIPAVIFQLVLEGAIVAAILLALPRLSKRSLRELGFRALAPSEIGIALLGAIAMIVVVEGGASLIQTLSHQKHEQSVVELFKHILGNRNTTIFFVIFACVLAPVMEETIFRVFCFNIGLRYGGFWVGAIVSGVLFGLAHGDLFVLLPLTLGGMILCGVYYRTGNAFASMITHGIFNGVTVLALIYAPQLAQ